MIRDSRAHRRGFTLIEILVAITIAGIVTTLSLFTYINLSRAFNLQSRTASGLRTTIVVQKRIDRACNRLSVVNHCTEREIAGIDAATELPTALRFDGSRLLEGTDTVVSGLQRFIFTLEENRKNRGDRNAVLLWEGKLTGGGWVGGAALVKR